MLSKGDIVRSNTPGLFSGNGMVVGFESRLMPNGKTREVKACVLWFEDNKRFYHMPRWLIKVEDRGE
jgi:hypothetical protein